MSTESPEEAPKLYAAREPIFPKRVSGTFRQLKWWLMGFTLVVYYVTPWLRWDRGPEMPNQAVLVDMANRRFFMFWIISAQLQTIAINNKLDASKFFIR